MGKSDTLSSECFRTDRVKYGQDFGRWMNCSIAPPRVYSLAIARLREVRSTNGDAINRLKAGGCLNAVDDGLEDRVIIES